MSRSGRFSIVKHELLHILTWRRHAKNVEVVISLKKKEFKLAKPSSNKRLQCGLS